MFSYSISEISSIIQSENFIALPNQVISTIAFDSRKITDSNGVLFFCINSEKDNGHNYIAQLLKHGVSNFIITESIPQDLLKHGNFLFVSDAVKALQLIAREYRSEFTNTVIGITGSNGKTIVKEWLASILSAEFNVFRSPKSYNSQIGVPTSVCLVENQSDYYIFEAGISKVGEMANLRDIIDPDYGIFTNIGSAHQKYFSNYKEKITEKLKLFESVKGLVYQKENSLLNSEIESFANINSIKLFSWSIINSDSDLFVTDIIKTRYNTVINYLFNKQKFSFSIPFIDDASIENSLHCLSCIYLIGINTEPFLERFKLLKPVAMRMELKVGINGCLIINDSYNSDINSLEIALDFLVLQKKTLKRTLILSDIEQSKLSNKALYSRVAEIIKKYKIQKLIAVGKNISANSNLFDCEVITFDSTSDFLNTFTFSLFKSEVILVKGARNFEFDKITRRLENKIHQTCLEVNLTAITDNLNYFKSKIYKKTKVMAMVKAFSYGSGSSELVNILQYNNIDYLAVAFVDEGIDLRKGGIHLPIMVMNPDPSSFDAMVEFDLEPEIYSFSGLEYLVEVAKSHGVNKVPVHIKLDSGMHRLGFEDYQINELTEYLKSNQQIVIKSVFTHLVGSEDSCHDNFTYEQVDKFKSFVADIRAVVSYDFICHALNSAGIERFPQFQFDMVRLGIGLYGGIKIKDKELRVVSTLKTYISQVRVVAKFDTVGYSRMGKLNRTSKIATIPIGYADGLNRKFGNGNLSVLVNNQFAPIVGNICMDMCMIDVTEIDANEGDIVTIFGEKPTIFELAEKIGTIPYEILTSISSRVNRLYYSE